MSDLPITAILPSLAKALEGHANVILAAEPGAGKTTRVPLALLDASWLGRADLHVSIHDSEVVQALYRRVGPCPGWKKACDEVRTPDSHRYSSEGGPVALPFACAPLGRLGG